MLSLRLILQMNYDVWNWSKMNETSIKRLYDKIKPKYDLSATLCGKPIDDTLQFQCSSLYRGWRYRVKEKHFVCHSRQQSRANRPAKVEREKWYWLVDFWMDEKTSRASAKNRENQLIQTIKPANGAKSTARILHDMLNAPASPHVEKEHQGEGSDMPILEDEEERDPVYVTLYERTKKHKDEKWDLDAEANYNALKKLHVDEIEKHGEDNPTVQEAFIDVLKTQPGYIRGLGPGSRLPKKDKGGGDSSEIRLQHTTQIQELQHSQQALAEWETTLQRV